MSHAGEDFTSLLDAPYRWPRRGDRLLRPARDWTRAAELEQHELSREAFVLDGYLRAARTLIEECHRDSHARHFLIYPILFTYRHGLELAMKSIISRYGGYASIDIGETDHHNLWKLWQVARDIIIEIGGEDEALPVAETIIKELHDLDQSALAFRYPRNRNGSLIPLPDGMIDLDNLRDVMDGVGHFFEGADCQLDYNVSAVDWHDETGW